MKKTTIKSLKSKIKKHKIAIFLVIILLLIIEIIWTINDYNNVSHSGAGGSGQFQGGFHKPVIYLYPEEKTDMKVTLNYQGDIFADYPEYNYDINGWDIIAYPDSTVIDKSDNKEYSYLFWEGTPKEEIDWKMDEGFVVKGSDTREFLQDILPKMGMTPKEYNEFVVYWYPIMQVNPYNLIHFSGKQYIDMAPLKTEPMYDSLLRVFMVVQPLDEKIEIKEQDISSFERKGFTVVEWGGTLLE